MTEEKKVIYAGITDRLFASTIDLAVMVVFTVVLFQFLFGLSLLDLVFFAFYPEGNELDRLTKEVVTQYPVLANEPYKAWAVVVAKHPESVDKIINQSFFTMLLNIVTVGLYFVPMTKIYGATLGKKIMGMQVADSITGKKLGWAQSFIRFICYLPSVGILGLGIFSGAINKRRRCWHDYLADSVVIFDENRWYKRQFDKVKKYFYLK